MVSVTGNVREGPHSILTHRSETLQDTEIPKVQKISSQSLYVRGDVEGVL